jgi:hypothetical protein
MMWNKVRILGAILLAGAAFTGCSGSGSVNASFDGAGHLEVHLTDAPLDLSNVASVIVTITGVIVYPGVEGMDDMYDMDGMNGEEPMPIPLMTVPETFDLLTLTDGATTLLAEGDLMEGFYQRIRIELSMAKLVYMDGTEEELKISSQKVDIPIPFELRAGEEESITLDFDAAASVKVNETGNGKLILRPVVTPVRF